MRRILYLMKEMFYLIRKERLYSLALILMVLLIVAFFVYQVTPIAIVTFVYAGI
jgi:hypothetical protein